MENIPGCKSGTIWKLGADGEYIGAEGRYGLGRVMVCDEADREGRMTVLQW